MAVITDSDLQMLQERARTEFASRCDTGGIAWDSVIWDLCNEVRRLRSVSKEHSDCAKLREALASVAKQLIAATEDENFGEDVMYLVGCMRTMARHCHAALAVPATELGSRDKAGDTKATRDGTGAADKGPPAFKVGERVDWTDPVTGEKTGLWTVLDVPKIPAEGPSGDEVYTISGVVGLSVLKVHARELSYPEGRPL